MNTLIRHKVRQWIGLDRQEDRYVQYEHQNCANKAVIMEHTQTRWSSAECELTVKSRGRGYRGWGVGTVGVPYPDPIPENVLNFQVNKIHVQTNTESVQCFPVKYHK